MAIITTRNAWISALALTAAASLAGCATSQEELLPTRPGVTMAGIWRQATAGNGGSVRPARTPRGRALQPPAVSAAAGGGDIRTAAASIRHRFPRLPNPDIRLYIFAHLSGGAGEQVPVPGYTTVFPLYTRPYYAQPGERSEYRRVAGNAGPAR